MPIPERPARPLKRFLKQAAEVKSLKLPATNRPQVVEQPIFITPSVVLPTLKLIGLTPAAYQQHLETTPQLPPAPELKLLAVATLPLLPAPQRYSPPSCATFEAWLQSDLGKEVQERLRRNRHRIPLDRVAGYFETAEDVQQKSLIWLWEYWQTDPDFTHYTQHADCLSHAAGILTLNAVRRARCRYAKRRLDGLEVQTELPEEDLDSEEPTLPPYLVVDGDSSIPPHDRPVRAADWRVDIRQAIERVVQRMLLYEQTKQDASRHPVPIEHITRTIIEGHLYHYEDRFSHAGNSGNFRRFCAERGVSKARIERWRPLIFQCLREELADYAPS